MEIIAKLESQTDFNTESYSEMFWRHGKQLLKGAVVLGAGILGYGAIRYFTRETGDMSDDNPSDLALLTMDNALSKATILQDDFLRQASNCLDGPKAGEFRVNTYTANDQDYPAIAGLIDGGFVAVWQSNGQDGSGYGIYGQRYSASNALLHAEFQVNTYTTNAQTSPDVTDLLDGGFVVVWQSNLQDGSGWGVYGQRYAASSIAVGDEFRVNTYTINDQDYPAIAKLADGDFVVVWQSNGQDGSGWGIYGQRYAASSIAVGDEFRVNTYTINDQDYPAIAKLADGDFVVVWQSNGQDGSGWGIYGQRYAASSMAVSGEFQVNTYTTSNQMYPAITGFPDGGFAVVWQSNGQDGSGYGIYSQRYAASNAPLGGEFQVNSYITNSQQSPAISSLINGNFVMVWESFGSDRNGWGVAGQRYTIIGIPMGSEFQVNTYTTLEQVHAAITALTDGSFVALWASSEQDGSGYGIYGQRYWGAIRVGNSCDGSYTEDTNYPLGLWLDLLTNVNPLNATLILQPAFSGQLINSTHTTDVTPSYDPMLGIWFATGGFTSINNLLQGLYFKPTLNYNQVAQISITVTDGASPTFFGNFTLIGIPVNDAPTLPFLNFSITQGQTIVLHTSEVPVNDVDNMPDEVIVLQQSVSHGNLAFANISQKVITNFTQAQLEAGEVLFIHDGSQNAPTLTLKASDGLLTSATVSRKGNFTVLLYLTVHNMDINQGERKLITTDILSATDLQSNAASVEFIMSNVNYGQFENNNDQGVAILQFNLSDIQANNIYFAHDNNVNTPSFNVQARQGQLYTNIQSGIISYNNAPKITRNNIVITQQGQHVVLSLDNIQAIDLDTTSDKLTFYVRFVQHGHFAYTGAPNMGISSFTQAEIAQGIVLFVQDGSAHKPAYALVVSDGLTMSAVSEGVVTFSAIKNKIPYTESTGFKSGISIALTAAGTLVGFAAWRYQRDQDAKRRRKQSIIANIIRDDLNLAGVHDFTSERGVQLLEAISYISKKLEKLEIEVVGMTRDEQENFAHKLAECLKAYVSHTPHKEILEGNIVTHSTRHLYYTKVKPFFKPNVGWLDTDKVKKDAVAIADQMKLKLNSIDEEATTYIDGNDGNKSILMQSLL